MGPTTLATWVLLITRALEERGVDANGVLRGASIDPKLLSKPEARYSVVAVQRLWAAALESTGDPCFGLNVGRNWHPTSFHALGYAALASATLREVLDLLVRYGRVVSQGADLEFPDRGRTLRLITRIPSSAASEQARHAAIQAAFAAVAVLCQDACGSNAPLELVTFVHDKPSCAARVEQFFACRVSWSSRENTLMFLPAALDTPLRTANDALRRINEQIAVHYLNRFEAKSLTERVTGELVRAMSSGRLDQARIAASLKLSARSLQRKLREEGTTFRELLDLARKRLSDLYSEHGPPSAPELAYLLGFAEERSFLRARNRWRARAASAGSKE